MARVRLSVAERREELLRAAIEQIEARGVAAVRIADVASALEVSNALVLYHFSTKEKLVAAAFTHAAEGDLARLRKLLGRRTTALRRLRSAVRWYAPTGTAKGWRLLCGMTLGKVPASDTPTGCRSSCTVTQLTLCRASHFGWASTSRR